MNHPRCRPSTTDGTPSLSMGHTAFGHAELTQGKTVIEFDSDSYSTERIFLRTILAQLGYEVESEVDVVYGKDEYALRVTTTMPWNEYVELSRKNQLGASRPNIAFDEGTAQ